MGEKLRCFIALDLPESIISELQKIQEHIKKEDLIIGKFTEKENLHLTLKFLGGISKEQVSGVQEKLRSISFKAFNADIRELGVFSEEFVRIIWVALNGTEVFELQSSVDAALDDIFPKETRFMSHVTIARVKNLKDKQKLLEHLKSIKIQDIKGKITSFSLIASTLKPEGAQYEVIERYKLG